MFPNPRRVTDWLQIFANLGIIGGLILVAIQINQNSSITKADLLSRGYEASLQYQIARMGENPEETFAKALLKPEELTPAEILVIRSNMIYWTNLHTRESALAKLGLSEGANRENFLKVHAQFTYGGNAIARRYWDYWSQHNGHLDFVEIVNKHLPEKGVYPTEQELRELMKAVDDDA